MFDFRARVKHLERGAWHLTIPCDDGTGGELRIVQAADGDLHFSMGYNTQQPNALEDAREAFPLGVPAHMANVRLRTSHGGGSHPALWLDLAKAFQKVVRQRTREMLRGAPLGTRAPAVGGGHWVRVAAGWQWTTGDTFPLPGGDWDGTLLPPVPEGTGDA